MELFNGEFHALIFIFMCRSSWWIKEFVAILLYPFWNHEYINSYRKCFVYGDFDNLQLIPIWFWCNLHLFYLFLFNRFIWSFSGRDFFIDYFALCLYLFSDSAAYWLNFGLYSKSSPKKTSKSIEWLTSFNSSSGSIPNPFAREGQRMYRAMAVFCFSPGHSYRTDLNYCDVPVPPVKCLFPPVIV